MGKIKILRIIARINIGGPAIHVILLAAGLDRKKFDSLLVCGNPKPCEGDMSYYAASNNVMPHIIPELRRELDFFNDLRAFIKIYRIITNERPNIIHTHTAKAGSLGRLAAIFYNLLHPRKRTKIVHTFHGHVFEGYFSKFKTKIFIYIERFLASFTDRIITLSPSIKRELISFGIGNEDRVEVVPLGFKLDNLLNLLPREGTGINIGIVGRLTAVKNHRLFLKAVTLVVEAGVDVKLRFKIIGDGELRHQLQKYAHDLGIADKVDFLGWQKDIPGVYSDLDIVALSSLNEGTPVSLIESMAAGKPIVATDVGGVKDLLGQEVNSANSKENFRVLERGIIVQSGDVSSFAAALIFLLRDRELRMNMGLSGREFAINQFSSTRLIKDIENLYGRILE